MRAAAATFLCFLIAFSISWNARAQDSPPIWAGVYTAAQAERGRLVVPASLQ